MSPNSSWQTASRPRAPARATRRASRPECSFQHRPAGPIGSADDDVVVHPELLVHEMRAMSRIGSWARDQCDCPGLVSAKLDLPVGRRTGEDPRAGEEAMRRKIVAAAGLVHELKRDGLAGRKMDRVWGKAEAPDADLDRRRGGLRNGRTESCSRKCGEDEKTNTDHKCTS